MCQCSYQRAHPSNVGLTLHFGPAKVPGVGLAGILSLHISGNAAGRNLCLALFSQENTENSPAEFVLADRRLGSIEWDPMSK